MGCCSANDLESVSKIKLKEARSPIIKHPNGLYEQNLMVIHEYLRKNMLDVTYLYNNLETTLGTTKEDQAKTFPILRKYLNVYFYDVIYYHHILESKFV